MEPAGLWVGNSLERHRRWVRAILGNPELRGPIQWQDTRRGHGGVVSPAWVLGSRGELPQAEGRLPQSLRKGLGIWGWGNSPEEVGRLWASQGREGQWEQRGTRNSPVDSPIFIILALFTASQPKRSGGLCQLHRVLEPSTSLTMELNPWVTWKQQETKYLCGQMREQGPEPRECCCKSRSFLHYVLVVKQLHSGPLLGVNLNWFRLIFVMCFHAFSTACRDPTTLFSPRPSALQSHSGWHILKCVGECLCLAFSRGNCFKTINQQIFIECYLPLLCLAAWNNGNSLKQTSLLGDSMGFVLWRSQDGKMMGGQRVRKSEEGKSAERKWQ